MRITQLMATFSQIPGVMMAGIRIRSSNNGLLLHVLATVASVSAIGNNVATLFDFYYACYRNAGSHEQQHISTLGASFVLVWVAVFFNLIQAVMYGALSLSLSLSISLSTPLHSPSPVFLWFHLI
jgi:hypothetical protein